jgi:hypothetical protein
MVEIHGDVVVFRTLRSAAERCATVRGLRAVSRDLLEWAKGLSSPERDVIDRKLRAAFGRGLEAGVAHEGAELARVVRRGRIANEREYRLVQARVEEIYANEQLAKELRNLDALLAAFRQP